MKILIVIPGLEHGGTNKSLNNFLGQASNSYDISVCSMTEEGVYKETFKKYLVRNISLLNVVNGLNKRKANLFKLIRYIFAKLYFKFVCKESIDNLYKKVAKKFNNKYDIVIAFQEGSATKFASCIKAKKHYAWVRCDYSSYISFSNSKNEEEIYSKYDNIVCVSKYTAEVFANCYPSLKEKVISIYNIIDFNEIIKESQLSIQDDGFKNDKFTFVSIGRFDKVKRFEYIPKIASELKNKGLDFYWYIIGDGKDWEKVKEQVKEYNVENCVIMLGAKSNPYPYIEKSDAVVCLSSTEACPNVINEGKILHKIIFSTDFPTAKEFIVDRENGIIATIDNIGNAIYSILEDKELLNKIQDNINKFNYNNEEQIKLVEGLLKE